MKVLKKIFAAVLAVAMIAVVAGCHPKDETAVTVGDYKFTSAYYMCALMAADSEAKTKVDEAIAAEEESADEEATEETTEETAEEVDYYSEKIDGKDYVTWVEARALENLKKIAAYKTLCKENELTLDEETESSVETYAEYYWSSYGYSYYYEPNGVGKTTYTNYMRDSYYSSLYFDHVYGEGGEKEIAAKDVRAKIEENFVIANVLSADFSEMDEETIESTKTQFEAYADSIQKGEKTFLEVYNEYNNIEETTETEDTASEETTSEETTEETEEELTPKDENASIIGAEDTSYESEYYEDIKAMKTGEVKVIEAEDESGINVIVKQDITADEYYYETLDTEARHLIADEEYEADILEYAKKLDTDVSKYAIGQFKVKKIKEPEYS